MKYRIFNYPFLFTLVLSLICTNEVQTQTQVVLEELSIEVGTGNSREVAYTNKQAGVFYTESNGEHRSAWQGWRIMSNELLDDYRLMIDESPLTKSEASAFVKPHQLVRTYPNNVKETVTLLDSMEKRLLLNLNRLTEMNLLSIRFLQII